MFAAIRKLFFKRHSETTTKTYEYRREYELEYRTDAGTYVLLPPKLDPYSILGVQEDSSHSTIKSAFRQKIHTTDRQQRAMVSLAYDMIGTLNNSNGREGVYLRQDQGSVEICKSDAFFLCIIGDMKKLKRLVMDNRRLLREKDAFDCSLIYLAARSGFYDVVEMLLSLSDTKLLNEQMRTNSTALHAASFYGHGPVVSVLLEYGIFTDVKNSGGSTAEEEARDESIKQIFKGMKADTIIGLAEEMVQCGLGKRIQVRKCFKGTTTEIVAREIERCKPADMDEDEWNKINHTWTSAWHGTKFKHIKSIFRNGLLPSGSKLDTGEEIRPEEGHIKMGVSLAGAKDWARAVFVSPTILYAGHVCYAERIQSSGATWCVLMKAKVEPKAFSAHGSTTRGYAPTEGEPDLPEYRINLDDRVSGDKYIVRIEQSRNVVVTSAMFVRLNFLETFDTDYGKTYSEMEDLLM